MQLRGLGQRGLALGTVLLCLVALTLVLFTAGSAAISHLRTVEASARQEHAQNLAEAALSKAMTQLVQTDFAFGKLPSDRLDVTVNDLDGALGTVTFNPSESGFSSGYSVSNLDSDDARLGAKGHQVPGRTVHLVARGKVGDTERWMECIYYKPPFPDGLAASGPVQARSLYLSGIRRGEAYSGGDPNSIDPEEILPGNLFSNFPLSGTPSVELINSCRINGTVGSVGGVSLDASCFVGGEVLPGSQARAIPELDVLGRMDALRPNAVVVSAGGGNLTLPEDWYAQANSGLQVNDIDLNGSALIVDGNLRVNGAISGTGVLLVNGDVDIRDGRSSLSANDQVAIGCTGDFRLAAESPEGNYFQGLVYCEGNMTAKDITVVGATVVNGKLGAAGSVELDNVRYLYNPGSLSLTLSKPEGVQLEEKVGHFYALSFALRRNDAGDGYLCDARAYFSDVGATDDRGGSDDDDLEPSDFYKDRPLDWIEQFGVNGKELKGNGSDTVAVEAWADQDIGSGPGDPKCQQLIDAVTAKVIEWAVIRDGGSSFDGDIPRIKAKVASRLTSIIDEQGDSYTMTFNLNNLLGELMGRSRILIWRPFE